MNTALAVAGLAALLTGGYYVFSRIGAFRAHTRENETFLKREFADSGVVLASTNALVTGRKEMPGMLVLLPSKLVYVAPDRKSRKEYPLKEIGSAGHTNSPVPMLTLRVGDDEISFVLPDAERWARTISETSETARAKTSPAA